METRQLEVLTKNWIACCKDDFIEAVGEIHQGNSIEAYYLFKNYVESVDFTLDIKKISKFKIYANLLDNFDKLGYSLNERM